MRKPALFLTAAFAGILSLSGSAEATQAPSEKFTSEQRKQIEEILETYLTEEHPEVVAKAIQSLQRREHDEAEAKTKAALVKEKARIFDDANSPVAGNPKGKVTIVEFYDYQCGFCKASEEITERILKEDKDVKFIFKNFPILSPASAEAAKAGLASVKQGKFLDFHGAMMKKKEHLTSDVIYKIAKDVGLDVEKLKKDMTDKSVEDALSSSMKLGHDLGVNGTPFFIVNDTFLSGVTQYDEFMEAINKARSKGK